MKKILESKYFQIGATIFLTGALLILFREMVVNFSDFREGLSKLIRIVSPFIYGMVIAYLLCPVYNFLVKKFYKLFTGNAKDEKSKKRGFGWSKAMASLLSVILLLGIVAGMIALIVPQLVDSVSGIVDGLPGRLEQFSDWIERFTGNMQNHDLAERIEQGWQEMQDTLISWARNKLLPGIGTVASKLSSKVMLTIKTFINMIIGVIACVYFLNGKERFRAQFKKTIMGITKEETYTRIFDFARFANHTFGGFISGKLLDSLIIGLICLVAMTIFGLPYPLLISTIIGVTNIIPFFGPLIGAVPSLIIILLVSPMKAFIFIIIVVLLQTLDGYILGPAILGNSTGLASFWVMFAIIIGGGFFGFIGMVVSVPVFAMIYYYLGEWMAKRLERKGLPKVTEDYIEYEKYDIDREELL